MGRDTPTNSELRQFTNEELNASIPFERGRYLRDNDRTKRLVADLLDRLEGKRAGQRALQARHLESRARTISAFVANLIVAAQNRIDPNRFVAVPFAAAAYSHTKIGIDALRHARDTLREQGLIVVQPGFFRRHHLPGFDFRRVTRIRVTDDFRDLLEYHGVHRRSVTSERERLIKLNNADEKPGQEPEEVEASRSILERINRRLAGVQLGLPDEAWARSARRKKTNDDTSDHQREEWIHAGDETAISLYRVFTRDWARGGRLYGGWWMNVPKTDRPLITIDGEPTVELDFKLLHPTLMFKMADQQLTFDPYIAPGFDSSTRPLGKETFNRLLNMSPLPTGEIPDLKRPGKEGRKWLPEGVGWSDYYTAFKRPLQPIARFLGKGIGLLVQRWDSEIALSIIDCLDQQGTVALPIHDSFIVKQRDEATLRDAMITVFRQQVGHDPDISRTAPARTHN